MPCKVSVDVPVVLQGGLVAVQVCTLPEAGSCVLLPIEVGGEGLAAPGLERNQGSAVVESPGEARYVSKQLLTT